MKVHPAFFLIFIVSLSMPLHSEECTPLILTLENALTRALNDNRQLLGTAEGVTDSQYSIEIAKSAFDLKMSPSSNAGVIGGGREGTEFALGGGLGVSKLFESGSHLALGPYFAKAGKHYHTEMRVAYTQPLLRGFGSDYQLSGVRGAQFSLRAARRTLYIAQVQLVVRTITALYDIIKAKKAVELSHDSHARISTYYQAAKLKERIGLSDALDVYRAEIELRQAQDTLTGALERLQETEDTLRDILALPLDISFEVEVPLLYTKSQLEMDKAVEMALENRVEIDQGIDQWRENYRLADISKKELYPDLNLVLNYCNSGRHQIFTRPFEKRRESTWGIGFTTSGDYDPLGDQFNYDQSLNAITEAARALEQTKSSITMEVKKAVRQLDRSQKRILLQEEQIHASQGELQLSKLKFDRGMANNFDVLQAEKNYRSAEQTYWNALIDHIIGEYQLLQAIGLLTEKPCIK